MVKQGSAYVMLEARDGCGVALENSHAANLISASASDGHGSIL